MTTKVHLFELIKIRLLLLLIAVVAIISLSAYLYFIYESKTIRTQEYEKLRVIAESKQDQIVNWRKERLADATMASESPLFKEAIIRFIRNPFDEYQKNRIVERLRLLMDTYNYEEAYLCTNQGIPTIYTTKERPLIDSILNIHIREAIRQRRNIFSDFYRLGVQGPIKLDIVAPIFNESSTPASILILRIDPYKYLYPLIESWPTPSKTAETIIVRRDSNNLLFLNELRHKKNTALIEHIPLTRTDIPGVQAILGKKGISIGIDYRNIPVIADVRSITGSPWFMVNKIDQDEILSELHFRSTILVIIVLISLLFFALFVVWLYHFRKQRIFKELFNAEKSLRETEEEFRTILYSIGDAIITFGTNGCIRHMNRMSEKFTGWNEEEAFGRDIETVIQIIEEKSKKKIVISIEEIMLHGLANYSGEKTVIVSRNGSITPINLSASAIYTNKNIAQGAILILHDQTIERQNEKEMVESRERLAFALDGANDGLWDVQMKTGEVYLSPRACEILGYTTENIYETIKVWTDLIYPKDLPAMQNALNDYFQKGSDYFAIEQRLKTKQDQYKWILTRGKVVNKPDYSGNARMVGTYTDITKRKETEEALIESEQRLSFAINGSNDGLWDINLSSGKIYINKRGFEIFGYPEQQVKNINKIWKRILHPDDLHKTEEALNALLKGDTDIINIEHRIKTMQGDYKYVLTRGKIVSFNEKGAPIRLVGTNTDISDRKAAETTLLEQERLLREIGQLAKIGGWEFDVYTMNGYWSDEAARIFGFPEKISINVEQALLQFRPESRSIITTVIKEAVELQKQFDVEFEIETIQKNRKWVRSIGGPVIELGKVIKVRGSYQDITDRKEAEIARELIVEQYIKVAREIENSRNKLDAVFNSVSDGIAVSDMQGNFFLVNKAQALINGFTSVEDMQKELAYFAMVYELKSIEGKPIPIEEWPISKVLRGESVHNYELHGYRNDSKREWYFSFSGEPVLDELGNQILCVIVTRDITQQMLTAISLKQHQEELHLLLTIAQAVGESESFKAALQLTLELVCKVTQWNIGEVWIPNSSNSVLELSDAWYCSDDSLKMFHNKGRQLTYKFGEGLPGRIWKKKKHVWAQSLLDEPTFQRKEEPAILGLQSAVGIPVLNEKKVVCIMVFFISQPNQNDKQFVKLISGIAIQLGQLFQRKRAEEALHESEERLRLSLTAAKQGLYDLNIQTGSTIVNEEYATMLGYAIDTFVETNAFWIERLHPDDLELTKRAYIEYVEGISQEYKIEFRQRTKDGQWKWILSTGKIVEYDISNKPLRMLGTHTDITERKEAELEILRLNETLEQKVIERTQQLETGV